MSTHRIETVRELWELVDRCARVEEGVRVPEEEEPEDKAAPAKSKKRDPGSDKRVFVTEPLPKKAKPASTSEGKKIHGATSTLTATTCSRTAAK